MITVDEFFQGQDEPRRLFEAVLGCVNDIGVAEIRVTKSQIAFRRRRVFASVWMPGQYLHGKHAPLVLTLFFRSRRESPRWKEIIEPAPGRFTQHLELFSSNDLDDEVHHWLQDAWALAV